jgi:hypothetical protein
VERMMGWAKQTGLAHVPGAGAAPPVEVAA